MVDDKKKKYLDIPAAKNSSIGQNMSVLNSEMSAGRTNPEQTRRIQAINAATAPTTTPSTRPGLDRVLSDPGGGGTLTTHGQVPATDRRTQAQMPRQAFKQDGYTFEGNSSDATKFFAPTGKGNPEAERNWAIAGQQWEARQPKQKVYRPQAPTIDPASLDPRSGWGWKGRREAAQMISDTAIATDKNNIARQALVNDQRDPTKAAQAGLYSAQTAKAQQDLAAQQTENTMLSILSDPNASPKDTNRARKYFQDIKGQQDPKPPQPKVFPGGIIEERDPVTNLITSRQLPPTIVDPATKTYEEARQAQPAQQYKVPNQAQIELMAANLNNPQYKQIYIQRYGEEDFNSRFGK